MVSYLHHSSEHFHGATNRAMRSYCYVMLEIKIEIFFLGYGALKYEHFPIDFVLHVIVKNAIVYLKKYYRRGYIFYVGNI